MYIDTCVSSSVCVNRECKKKRNKRVEKYIMARGGRKVVEITRQRQREKDKRGRDRYQREEEKEIKQHRKTDKSLNSYPGREVDGK